MASLSKQISTKRFEEFFKGLNELQKKAVELIDGPVMVIAGPGTGKTHVLAGRIAYILSHTDTPAYSILALTFTESAASNMRDRVVKLIGKSGYYVNIQTFHSFCSDVISTHPEYFPIDYNSEPLKELEKYTLLEDILLSNQFEAIKPVHSPLFYLKSIMSTISDLKKEGIHPQKYKEVIEASYTEELEKETKAAKSAREKNYKRNIEVQKVFDEYQKKLYAMHRYDFDDMISFVVDAFSTHEDLLLEYQEKLHYFLVDEYQDTNNSQNQIVRLLASYWGENANVFVVGDPHQSIYRFQGASIENTLSFTSTYKQATVITLTIGYRSPQNIYDAAYEVIAHNALDEQQEKFVGLFEPLQQPKEQIQKDEHNIYVVETPSNFIENHFVVHEIEKLISKGVKAEQIAILYRNHADSAEIQELLAKKNIRFDVVGGSNILHEEIIRQIIAFMKVLQDIQNGTHHENLFEVMMYDWTPIEPMLVLKIGRAAGKARLTLYNMISSGYENFKQHYDLDDVTQEEFALAEVYLQTLNELIQSNAGTIFTEWVENILTSSGCMPWVLNQPHKIVLLTKINSLYNEIKAMVRENHDFKMNDFLKAIEVMNEHKMTINSEDFDLVQDAVHLSTVHKAKGQEWEYVFILKCVDKAWGNSRNKELIQLPKGIISFTDLSKKERNEDDRRLFYVALTRAKKRIYILYPKTVVMNSYNRSTNASMFLYEIKESKKYNVDITHDLEKISNEIENILKPTNTTSYRDIDEAFFTHVLKDFKLSVTDLNKYLSNEKTFVEEVLLRVPKAKPAHMAFGTAVHKALEMMYVPTLKNETIASLETVLNYFNSALQKEILDVEDFEKFKKIGYDLLPIYYDKYKDADLKPIYLERQFGRGLSATILDDIPLTGRIDRVDSIDQEKKSVRVVDYKTGSSKTSNEIAGLTLSAKLSDRERSLPESIRGPYKRQLLFYKLLFELDPSSNYTVESGMFDFVKPDSESKKLVQRHFILQKEEVEDLKDLIRTVMKEIRELKFLEF